MSEDNITLLKNSPIKIFVDHLQRRNFFWLNNFKLKILRGEFFQNYGISSYMQKYFDYKKGKSTVYIKFFMHVHSLLITVNFSR